MDENRKLAAAFDVERTLAARKLTELEKVEVLANVTSACVKTLGLLYNITEKTKEEQEAAAAQRLMELLGADAKDILKEEAHG